MPLDAHGRIARGQPSERLGQRVLVAASRRLHGQRQQRLGHVPRCDQQRAGLVRHGVAGLRAAEPPDGADVAGDRPLDRAQRGSQRRVQLPDPLVGVVVLVPVLGAAVSGDVHGGVGRDRPGEHPQHRQPAEVGVDGGAHDLGHQRPVRVAVQCRARRAGQRGRGRWIELHRGREAAGEDLEQFGQPQPGRRAHRQHRVERAAGDRRLQVVDQHLQADLLAGEVTVQQRLVLAVVDDRLDERAPLGVGGGLAGRPGGLAGREAGRVVGDRAGEQAHQRVRRGLFATADRQVHRQHGLAVGAAEHLLAGRDRRGVVGARRVQLGDHDGTRRAEGGALLPQRHGDRVDVVGGRDDEQRGVGGAQPGPQLAGEVGVAGCVEQVHHHVVPAQRAHRQRHRALLGHFDRVVVADGAALGDRAGAGDRAGGRQQGLDQGRLAAAGMADQGDVADLLGTVGRVERGRRGPGGGLLRRHRGALHSRSVANGAVLAFDT